MAKPSSQTLLLDVRFSSGTAIDSELGVLRGVSVAEIGEATGHFVALDKAGMIIGVDDPEIPGTVRRLPLCADQKTLDSIVEVGAQLGRVKAREDHDDSIASRAGYVECFRMEDGKAVCDLTVFDAYQNRATFLEAATKTPEMIGLSGHFKFIAEIIGDQAFMRVTGIEAVDIVDEGALTHTGLFRALPVAPTVDNNKKVKTRFSTKPTPPMANAPKLPAAHQAPHDPENIPEMPDLEAFKAMCEHVGAYAAAIHGNNTDFASKLAECMSAIEPVVVPTPPGAPAPVTAHASNPDASVHDPVAAFKSLVALVSSLKTEMDTKMAAMKTDSAKHLSALGLKPGATPAPAAAPEPAPATVNEPTTFLAIKAKVQKEQNLKPGAAAEIAMKTHPEAYRAYLKDLGIYDAKKDPRQARAS